MMIHKKGASTATVQKYKKKREKFSKTYEQKQEKSYTDRHKTDEKL